ncbi:MAG: hypothetical protein R3B48_06385 [Kofleriaceae bacterium]
MPSLTGSAASRRLFSFVDMDLVGDVVVDLDGDGDVEVDATLDAPITSEHLVDTRHGEPGVSDL